MLEILDDRIDLNRTVICISLLKTMNKKHFNDKKFPSLIDEFETLFKDDDEYKNSKFA